MIFIIIPLLIKPLIYKGKNTGYYISDEGDLFRKNGKKMKIRYTPGGYAQLCLRIHKKPVYVYTHRAVYEAFRGEIPEGLEINHIDGNKLNNKLTNLELTTRMENIKHSWEHGLAFSHNPHEGKCTQNMLSKDIPDSIVHQICKDLENPSLRYIDIASRYKTRPRVIYGIARGWLWPEISKDYDIKGRVGRKSLLYKDRDKLIESLYRQGFRARAISEKLNLTLDAVNRRIYLMRKRGIDI